MRPERLIGILAVLLVTAAVVAVIAVATAPRTFGSPEATEGGQVDAAYDAMASVLRVVDGDTILVEVNGARERVRYIGLDAPEVASAENGTAAECGAEAARSANEALVTGATVGLERDITDRDRFGRLLRHVWLLEGEDRLVGAVLVVDGAVEARSYPPDTGRDDELDALEGAARAAGAGIWGSC
jgi:micrococcal nuclease